MQPQEIEKKVIEILAPHAKDADALARASAETSILEDLQVNSARLVDAVLEFEDTFDVAIDDEDLDAVVTIGDCVTIIQKKRG